MTRKLFHHTSAKNAAAILKCGFREGTGTYLTTKEYSGVWLSDVPLDENEGACGDTLLEVMLQLAKRDLNFYEWREDGKGYREWLIPSGLSQCQGDRADRAR